MTPQPMNPAPPPTPAPSEPNPKDATLLGSERILQFCLELKPGSSLAIFHDETTSDVAEVLQQAATAMHINPVVRNVSCERQFGFCQGDELAAEDMEALWETRAMISCLTDDPSGTSFRKKLLEDGLRDTDSRVAHMPGATLELLAMAAEIEYEEAGQMCDYLGAVLALGRDAELETYALDAEGQPKEGPEHRHVLRMELGGSERLPITSSGTIPSGTWGNVPGGETFIAPIEGSAEGSFVLNGAFTDRVLKPPAHLVLYFTGGALVRVEGDPDAARAFNVLFVQAMARRDPHWKDVAELGIGVNRGVRQLTGKSLFDEKIYGTAHIAVGDNDRFGGRHASAVHEDMVTIRPSLWVDGSPVLARGRLVYDLDLWRDRLDAGAAAVHGAPGSNVVQRTIINTSDSLGVLRVNHEVGANRNRRCTYTVGDQQASRVLARLHRLTPKLPAAPLPVDELLRRARAEGLDEPTVRRGLWILVRHHLIDVRDPASQPRGSQ